MSRAPRKLQQAPGGITPVRAQEFKLTPEEHAWAKRMFSALRGMEPEYRKDALSTYVCAIELTAARHPLRQSPVLRIVKGGMR